VAGYQYVLDTQNKVAHRQALPAPGSRPAGFMGGPAAGAPGALIVRQAPAVLPASGGSGGPANFGVITSAIPAPAGTPARPNFSRESLGTQSIDGVLAEGTRTTTTYPAGMVGNDREFSATSESWMSPDLKVMVLSKNNDPRQGESTFRLENLSRTPPDPALFMVPADYTVTDETGPFTIHFTNR
jgi:hypothetical protein